MKERPNITVHVLAAKWLARQLEDRGPTLDELEGILGRPITIQKRADVDKVVRRKVASLLARCKLVAARYDRRVAIWEGRRELPKEAYARSGP